MEELTLIQILPLNSPHGFLPNSNYTGITKENIRDYASGEQLIILVNIESMNADMIRDGIPMSERLKKLRNVAYYQMQSLTRNKNIGRIKNNLIQNKSDSHT